MELMFQLDLVYHNGNKDNNIIVDKILFWVRILDLMPYICSDIFIPVSQKPGLLFSLYIFFVCSDRF